jgi:tRNA-2-methylthio-N6-dimethylallyladenosine synthase
MSETPTTRRVYLETFGCQMNDYDTARMMRLLETAGYEKVELPKDADLILVNTCSVRDKAEQKALSRLGRLKSLRRTRPGILLGVTGCFAQREGEKFLRRMPYIDLILGTGAIERLPEHIRALECGRGPIVDIDLEPTPSPVTDFGRHLPGKGSSVAAFLTIMRGCDNYCAYCVVPYVRGPERSRPPDDILREARGLITQGAHELTLLGQNVNSYGRGLGDEIDFPRLLTMVHDLDGLTRLRFTTSHPKDLSDRLIDAFAKLPKLAPHLHLPVQAGSNQVLARMNRGYTVEQYLARVDALRAARPGIAVTTDILVGFPGETDDDFRQTCDLVESVRYSNAFKSSD